MIHEIITALTGFVIHVISSLGYAGVALLMAIESACIPLPSEIIMPFSGYLVFLGRFNLLGISIASGIGSCIGSAVIYWLAKKGGRPLVEKYGKYFLISKHDLDIADHFFQKYGQASTFVGRMLPVVRTYISVPAGISGVKFWPFMFWCFLGSFIWGGFLGYLGMKLGENWSTLRDKLHGFDTAIIVLIVLAGLWWVWRHVKQARQQIS